MLFTALLILISTPAHGGEVKLRDHDQKIYTAAEIVHHPVPAWVQESRHNLVKLLNTICNMPEVLGNIVVEFMGDDGCGAWFPHTTIKNNSHTTGKIMHIVPLSQGRLAAAWSTTCNEDTIITVYDAGGYPQHTLQPEFEVSHLAACSQGTAIATSCSRGSIKVWKLTPNEARLRRKLSTLLSKHQVHENQFLELEPHRLVTCNHSTLQLWDTQNQKCLVKSAYGNYMTTPLVKLSTGNIAVGCCAATSRSLVVRHMLMLWNTTTGALKHLPNQHNNRITTIAALPEGLLATTAYVGEKIITVWDTNACKPLHTLRPYCGNAYSLCALSNGTLASGAYNAIDIWDPIAGKRLRTLHHKTIQSVDTLLELPFGRLAAGSNNITIWDVAQGVCLQTLPCDQQIAILKSLSTGALLSADSTGKITIWNSAIHPTAFSHQKPQSYCRIS